MAALGFSLEVGSCSSARHHIGQAPQSVPLTASYHIATAETSARAERYQAGPQLIAREPSEYYPAKRCTAVCPTGRCYSGLHALRYLAFWAL